MSEEIKNMANTRVTGFQSVSDFHAPRSWLAVAGFYFFYLLIGLVLCGTAGGLTGAIVGGTTAEDGYRLGVKAGRVVAVIYCTGLYGIIVYAQRAWRNPWHMAGIAATLIASLLGGTLLGLIPATIAIGIRNKKNTEQP